MIARRWLRWLGAALAAACALPALSQAPTFEEVRTLTRGPEPVVRIFTVTTAGVYRLTLTDLAVPVAFGNLQAAVTRGDTVVATLTAPGSIDVNATVAGSYALRVVGIPGSAGAGSFGARIVNPAAGDAVVLEFADAIDSPPPATPANRRTVDTRFEITTAGNYEVWLADHAFPSALSTLTLAIVREGGAALDAQLTAAGSTTFAATPGWYRLLVIGEASGTDVSGAGAFGVRVRNAASLAVVYARSEPVGRTREVSLVDPLQSGAHELQVADLAFPAPLTAAGALLTADGVVVTRRDAAGTAAFNATAGAHQLLVLAASNGAVPGSLGVELRRGTDVALSTVITAPADDSSGLRVYSYPVQIATAGDYRLRLTDFEFPGALQARGFAAVQNGARLASSDTAGNLNLTGVAAGPLFVVAYARPAAATSGGLLGIDLVSTAAGAAPLLERTEGIGALFFARSVHIATAGEYQAFISDLRFPAQFSELAAVVTRGAERLGSVFAGGTFNFNGTPGDYQVSVIAQPAAAAVFGTYALRVAPRPAAPAVTFAADSTSVTNGGTAMLTWTSTNAATCTASGGWSGSRALTGSERTAAITVSTTYTLNCDGPGGQKSASVTVTPQAAGNGGGEGGGGGSFDWLLLGLLAAMVGMARVPRGARGRFSAAAAPALAVSLALVSSFAAGLAKADDVMASALTIPAASPAARAVAPLDAQGYRVQPGDVLVVAVWKERDLQGELLVRPDGGITFPLAGDITAGGRTVVELAGDVSDKLKKYIPDPVVTVAVKSIGGNRIYVLGKVNRPGEFPFSQPLDVMQALALAGGATPFAAVNDIRILRRDGGRLSAVEFQYADVERGRKLEQNIVLRSGDTVVVP